MKIETVGLRIKEEREKRGWTQAFLADKLNIKIGTLSGYERGYRNPDIDMLSKIAATFGVTTDYLLGHESKKPVMELGEKGIINFIERYGIEKLFQITRSNKSSNYLESIPLLGQIRAGIPLLAEENWEDRVDVPNNLKADFALRVVGDSMSWVGIHDGDIAILRQSDVAQHGMIVAAGIEEETWSATLKFYVQENGEPKLRAANPEYEDIIITPAHRIIGVVVGIQKEPPSISTYRDHLIRKELLDKDWGDTVEKAISLGFSADQVREMVEVQWELAQRLLRRK